jgi:hypothetical protein
MNLYLFKNGLKKAVTLSVQEIEPFKVMVWFMVMVMA